MLLLIIAYFIAFIKFIIYRQSYHLSFLTITGLIEMIRIKTVKIYNGSLSWK